MSISISDPSLNMQLNNIMNCFSGDDGGVSFIRLRSLIETMHARAVTGDDAAKQLIDVVSKMSRLIDVANSIKTD
jgi:hypothetical protein